MDFDPSWGMIWRLGGAHWTPLGNLVIHVYNQRWSPCSAPHDPTLAIILGSPHFVVIQVFKVRRAIRASITVHGVPSRLSEGFFFGNLMKLRWLEDPSGRDWWFMSFEFLNLLGCSCDKNVNYKKHLGFFLCKRKSRSIWVDLAHFLPLQSSIQVFLQLLLLRLSMTDTNWKSCCWLFALQSHKVKATAMFHGWVKEKIRTNQRVDVSKPLKIYSINIYPASQPPSVPEILGDEFLLLQLHFPKKHLQ